MKTILIYLLVTVSNDGYNHGVVSVVGEFASRSDCEDTAKQLVEVVQMEGVNAAAVADARLRCISARVINRWAAARPLGE